MTEQKTRPTGRLVHYSVVHGALIGVGAELGMVVGGQQQIDLRNHAEYLHCAPTVHK